ASLQHDKLDGPPDLERAALFCSVRARGHGRAHSRQDRGLETKGHVDGRGQAPLGYDAKEGKLAINAEEAETVRTLFRLYREVGTVRRLKESADQLGL